MIFTRLALSRLRVTVVALLFVLLGGMSSYQSLPRAEDPGFTIRTAVVTTAFPGASPDRVENLVTSPVEEIIQQIPEVETIRSSSATGLSIVYVEVSDSVTDLRAVWDELRRRIDDVSDDLPAEARTPVVNDRFGDVYGTLIAVIAEGYTPAERYDFADALKERLLQTDDAAKVEIYGDQPRRVYLTYDNARLAGLGLSPMYLAKVLQQQNIVSPGGTLEVGRDGLALEPSGSFDSIEELASTPVPVPGGAVLALGDLVSVTNGTLDPPAPVFRYRGEDAHLVGVSLREGGNILQLGEDLKRTLEQEQARYPHGVEFEIANFQPEDVQIKVSSFVTNLVQAVVIVIVVMVIFLGFRTGIIVASLIPGAMVATFLLMGAFGVGIDQMSLAGLLIALGMLVDNAIVMSETCLVRLDAGQSPREAALGASKELWAPLLVSSLTTAAAFLPFYLGQGGSSEFVAPIFKVVTMALLASWMLAMTMIPLFCAYGLKPPTQKKAEGTPQWIAIYERTLRAVLLRPMASLAAATGALVLALYGFGNVPVKFFPPSEKPAFVAQLEFAPGTTLENTAAIAAQIDHYLATIDDDRLVSWATMIGDTLPRFVLTFDGPERQNNVISALFTTRDRFVVDGLMDELNIYLESTYPEALVLLSPLQLGPPVDHPVAFKISGNDIDGLMAKVRNVEERLRQTQGLRAVGNDWGWRTKKIRVVVDPTRSRLAGVTNQDVATSLLTGVSGLPVTDYRDGDDVVPVVLRGTGKPRVDELDVFSATGSPPVPLAQVADLDLQFQFPKIRRENRRRLVTVYADTEPGFNAAAISKDIVGWLDTEANDWDAQYRWEEDGEAQASAEANESVMSTLPIAVMVIGMLLVIQFNSIRRSVINVIVLPYAFVGVTVGLLVTGSYFGFMTLLGIISLFGVVINNANVLIDRIDLEIAEGTDPPDAIMAAARSRLRPILLTTATTVLGLIPLWLGGGPMFQPMAVVLIFGLLFGTVLTLALVPLFYSLFFRIRFDA
jgi:multidrug efflux pump subunit AcrB